MNRKELFKSLSDPVKELMTLLYHSEKEFIIAEPVALEDLLLSYDKVIGNDVYVKKIAGSIYLNIPLRVDPDLYFLTTIETFLMEEENQPEQKTDSLIDCRETVSEMNPKVRNELSRLRSEKAPQNPELYGDARREEKQGWKSKAVRILKVK